MPIELALKPVPQLDSCVVIQPGGVIEREGKRAQALLVLQALGPMKWEAWWQHSTFTKSTFNRVFVELRESQKILKENGLWRVTGPISSTELEKETDTIPIKLKNIEEKTIT